MHVYVFSSARASHTSAQQCQRLRASTPASSEPVTYLITQFDTPRGPPGCVLNFPLSLSSLPNRPGPPPPPLHFLFTRSLTVLCCCLCPSFTFNPPAEAKKQNKTRFWDEKQKQPKKRKARDASSNSGRGTRCCAKESRYMELYLSKSLYLSSTINAPECVFGSRGGETRRRLR